MQIHGGGWVIGDKREQGIPLLRYLAARGWVGFNVNYRLSPGATFPDHLVDLKAALAWIREHADEYGIDPDFVVVTGGSAGGHLTALMALTANDPRYQPGFEDADTSVQAAVPFYGVYDFTNRNGTMAPGVPALARRAARHQGVHRRRARGVPRRRRPSTRSTPTRRRSSSSTATTTRWRRWRTPALFVERLREVSTSEVFYVELHGAQHAFDVFGSPRTRRMVQATERFLFAVHDAYLHRPDSAAGPAGRRERPRPVVEPAASRPLGRFCVHGPRRRRVSVPTARRTGP